MKYIETAPGMQDTPGGARSIEDASSRRKGAAFRIFSCLSVKIFLSLAQDRHLTNCRPVSTCFELSEGSKESPDSEEANEIGAAGLLGSGIPGSGRSGRIAGRVMGSNDRVRSAAYGYAT